MMNAVRNVATETGSEPWGRMRRAHVLWIMLFLVPVLISVVFYLQVVIFPRVPTRVVIDMDRNVMIDTRAAGREEMLQERLPSHVPIYSRFWDGTEVPGYYFHSPTTGLYRVRTGKQPGMVKYTYGKGYELVWSDVFYSISHPSYFTVPTELRGSMTNEVKIEYHPLLK